MLVEYTIGRFEPYHGVPTAYNDAILLDSSGTSLDPFWGHGVGRFDMQSYGEGDVLQWAIEVMTPTPPAGIRFSVQDGRGRENNLSIHPWVIQPRTTIPDYFQPLPEKKSLIVTEPVAVSLHRPTAFIFLDGANKQALIYHLALGDPDSIASYVRKSKREDWFPISPLMGPPLPAFLKIYWPWYKET